MVSWQGRLQSYIPAVLCPVCFGKGGSSLRKLFLQVVLRCCRRLVADLKGMTCGWGWAAQHCSHTWWGRSSFVWTRRWRDQRALLVQVVGGLRFCFLSTCAWSDQQDLFGHLVKNFPTVVEMWLHRSASSSEMRAGNWSRQLIKCDLNST